MKDVAFHTRLLPGQRHDSLRQFVDNVNGSEAAKAHLSAWGLSLDRETVNIQGRILPRQILYYGGKYKEGVAESADWARTATSKPCLTTVDLVKWVIVYEKKVERTAQDFFKMLESQAKRIGILVAIPTRQSLPNDRTETFLKGIRDNINLATQLVVIIVPNQRGDRYAAIKKLCCVDRPVASQVILQKTLSNEKRLTSVVQKV